MNSTDTEVVAWLRAVGAAGVSRTAARDQLEVLVALRHLHNVHSALRPQIASIADGSIRVAESVGTVNALTVVAFRLGLERDSMIVDCMRAIELANGTG